MSRIVLLTWVGKQCSCVVIVSLYSRGAWKKILWRTRLFCICIKLFKLICNFFKNWLYVKYQLLNLYVAVNYFEGQLVLLTRGNPKYVWSLDGREASSAECPLLPRPSSDILWGSFLALDGTCWARMFIWKVLESWRNLLIDDEIIPTHEHAENPKNVIYYSREGESCSATWHAESLYV